MVTHNHSQPGVPRGDTDKGWIDEGLSPVEGPIGDGGVHVEAKLVGEDDYGRETPVQKEGRERRNLLVREMEETGGWGRGDGGGERGERVRMNRSARFDIGATAKVYGLRALATIVEIMEDVKEPAPVRLAAAKEVLDRGFGRPKSVMEVGGLDGDEIRNRLVIEFVAPGTGRIGGAGRGDPTERTINEEWNEREGKREVAKRAIEQVATEVATRPSYVNPWAKEE